MQDEHKAILIGMGLVGATVCVIAAILAWAGVFTPAKQLVPATIQVTVRVPVE